MFEIAREILIKLEDNGFLAYIVGGYVRDYYLGIPSSDIDICTNALPDDVDNIFKDYIITENRTSRVLDYKNYEFVITTFRKDLEYDNHRKVKSFEFLSSLEEDLKRRDFTMNTLVFDKDKNLIDKYNGLSDIDKKTIRCVGDADSKLNEDVLRILRAFRFMSTLGFSFDSKLLSAIDSNKDYLRILSHFRIKEELSKIFMGKYVLNTINEMNKHNIFSILGIDSGNIKISENIYLIWKKLGVDLDLWEFSNEEKEKINNISE